MALKPKVSKAVRAAQALLTREVPGRFPGRADALRSIARAAQPMTRAKQLVQFLLTRGQNAAVSEVDLSDTQELRVHLVNRDGGLDPLQAGMLHRLELKVLKGMTRAAYLAQANRISGMPPAFSKAQVRGEVETAVSAEERLGDVAWLDAYGFIHRRPSEHRRLVRIRQEG